MTLNYNLINGNSAVELAKFPDNHFDSVVCDPPYGINFLGKDWDANTGEEEVYRQCLRVLKPGGYLLAFSAARTYHHLAMSVERVGFEIRDQIMWIYSSGFPKSQDVGRQIQKDLGVKETRTIYTHDLRAGGLLEKKGATALEQVVATDDAAKEWSGWGSALKPAHEPIVMARKPLSGTIKDNVREWGVGAVNIDATRIETDEVLVYPAGGLQRTTYSQSEPNKRTDEGEKVMTTNDKGRFPTNVIGEIEGYQKYYYCPKIGKAERNIGDKNTHPTVKPVDLMSYLVKMVTPQGGHVLDPFNGSGSTGMACAQHGYQYTGIELDPEYYQIAKSRIEAWYKHCHPNNFNELFTVLS